MGRSTYSLLNFRRFEPIDSYGQTERASHTQESVDDDETDSG